MKKLYLLRHAKSSWKNTKLQDFDRPLNQRGLRDAPEMGRRLLANKERPDLIVSSTAVRAVATARAVAAPLRYPIENINFRDELYHASAQSMLSMLRQIDHSVDFVLWVGHNPGLNELANLLSASKVENIVTSGIYALSCPISNWAALKPDESAELLYYDYPKKNRK